MKHFFSNVKPYIYEVIIMDANGDSVIRYQWQCAGDESRFFDTLKEAEIDFMWYLFDTRKILPGQAIRL